MKTEIPYNLKITKELNAPSPVFNELLSLFNKDDLSLVNLLNIVSKDITISANLLRYANSAYFGNQGKVYDLKKSIELIGLVESRNIAFSNVIVSFFSRNHFPDIFDFNKFWLHSFLTANISKFIAGIINELDENDCYIIGLLHEIGWLIIALYIPENYKIIKEKDSKESYSEPSIHSIIGMNLLKLWNLPEKIYNTILFCNNPENGGEHKIYAYLISLSSKISKLYEDNISIDKKIFYNYIELNLNNEKQDKIITELPFLFNKTKEQINLMEF